MKRSLTMASVFLLIAGVLFTGQASAQSSGKASASGHGTTLVTGADGRQERRQFSFSAIGAADGTAKGNAVLHNPEFTGTNGKPYQLQIRVTCMRVFGNIAIIAGVTKRTNDPNLPAGAAFVVQDNGEPGKNSDSITQVNFFDLDPTAAPDFPCTQDVLTELLGFSPLEPIESGNVQVKGQ